MQVSPWYRFFSLMILLSTVGAGLPSLSAQTLTETVQTILNNLYGVTQGGLGVNICNSIDGVTCDPTHSWLIQINLNRKGLNGSLPLSIGDLINLTSIDLGGNQLTGTIPDTIGRLVNLKKLDLGGNRLIGPLPDSIGNLTSLTSLVLNGNELNGIIPPSIGDLVYLEELHLFENQFNGSIPPSIGNMRNLRRLFLQSNQLSGFLPSEIGNLSSLIDIQMSNNSLTGGVIQTIIDLPLLLRLDLSNNQLNGTVPTRSAGLSIISDLLLDHNSLTSVGYVEVTNKCLLNDNSFSCGRSLNVSLACSRTVIYLNCPPISDTIVGVDRLSTLDVVQWLYDDATKISIRDAEDILDGVQQNHTEIARVISAVILALLRNTTSFDYHTRDVYVKFETFNISNGGGVIHLKLDNSSIAVDVPTSYFTSQQQVSVALLSVPYNLSAFENNDTIYSPVIGVSVYADSQEIDVYGVKDLINITMGVVSLPDDYEGVCQYWNETHKMWSRDGCSLVVDEGITICQCTHLTNFSVGAEPVNHPSQVSSGNKTKLIIIVVCCSVGGLLLILIVSLLAYRKVYRYKRVEAHLGLAVVVDTEGIVFEEMIGKGKRGQVWKSIYKETTVVAVKKLIEGIDIDRECDVMKGLHHPNIVQYLGRNISERYVMMEYMNDATLHHFLSSQHPLTVETMFLICEGVSKAVSYITSQGMVHTSVTPSKILLNGTTAKLNCLSCIVTESTPYCSKLDAFYTAPEVIEEKRYTASGHVYNVGVLLWSMVIGNHHLYETARGEETELRVTVNETMDERVAGLITDCTKEREERLNVSRLAERLGVKRHPRVDRGFPKMDHVGHFRMFLCLFLVLSMPERIEAVDLVKTMQNIWTAFNGPSQFWKGANVCNSSDYTGVVCDVASSSWPIEIILSNQALSGIISPSIGDLINLTSIDLGNNELTGFIPPSIGDLSSLQSLSLFGNHLSGSIPDSIGMLSLLTDLNLAQNQLTGSIPSTIGNMTSLLHVSLFLNGLTGPIPDSIGNLTSLQTLSLHDNHLSGPIPDTMSHLTLLTELDLSINDLDGTISIIGNLTSLTSVSLNQNQLSGVIPDSIGNLHHLTGLDFGGNQLNGSIPDAIGKLRSLQSLSLYSNILTGPLPDSIGNLTNVTHVYVHSNRLSGPLPDTIGHLINVIHFEIHSNQLSGPIPDTISNLSSLEYLDLGSNLQLNGSIPSSIGDLSSLRFISLYSDSFTGTIPDSIGRLSKLSYLNFAGNQLSGNIPDTIGNLSSLNELILYDNQLRGVIPSTIGNMTLLAEIDVHGNQLNGTIPPSIALLTSLQSIQLSGNQLTGDVPDGLINLPLLSNLDLSNNLFNGVVPKRRDDLPGLVSLFLNDNRFTYVGYINVTVSCSLQRNTLPCQPHLNVSSTCDDPAIYNGCINYTTTSASSSSSSSSTIITSTMPSTSTISPVPSTRVIDGSNVSAVIQSLYNNNTKISVTDAKNILNATTLNREETAQVISAVVVALLRNTSTTSFEYNTRDVSVKLQTYNTSELSSGKSVTNKIENSSIAVALPASVFTSQQQVIGVSVYAQGKEIDVRGVDQLINITMGSITSIPSGYEGVCQYWNETYSLWSRDGCSLVVDGGITVCQCTHLTNFSVGIRPIVASTDPITNSIPESTSNKTKLIIIIVCCVVGGLLLVLIVSFLVYRKDDTEMDLTILADTEGIELQKKIAEGKRGQVWKSIYKETTVVAVKKLIEGIDIDRECDVMKGLHHPNIVQYLGRHVAERYVVMEWMNDDTLDDFLSSHPKLNIDTTFTLCEGVSKGLSYIGSMGMVHISVVPKKILLSGMTAKLNGLSCIVAESTPYPSKLDYFCTAPEVIEEKRYRASGHVYNVGVLLWSMVTGSHPLYEADREVQVIINQTMDPRAAGLIVDCTKKMEERPSLKEVTERLAVKRRRPY
ncbi:putative LRR receptor-like serine/threonine-protein kinase [Planoprotostelium fungivorum]|uniref:Putative LRR receptor-like serine/threonine-protein kinase n=1 Tax=Planoprotostelium fungivorum TaxID=1890364 RepID=A0A2P6NNY6_9EUKA|nr:putative LRR receptor-like serine/threonine-protein kinase [Planoprotostelium fungivorum]